jgi:hypothetical protein
MTRTPITSIITIILDTSKSSIYFISFIHFEDDLCVQTANIKYDVSTINNLYFEENKFN